MKDLTIDFSSLRFNLKEISETRLLSQNINGRLLKLFMGIITSEIQELLDAIVDLMEYRTIQEAQGPQLDALGRIVGQKRLSYNYDENYWFSPDKTDVQPDIGHWWSYPAEQAIIESMDDDTYRQWIWLKVLENHNKFSAKEEVENIIAEGINEEVGIVRTGSMVGKIYCKDGISLTNYNLLDYHKNNLQVDNQFVFPYSATTSISSVERR